MGIEPKGINGRMMTARSMSMEPLSSENTKGLALDLVTRFHPTCIDAESSTRIMANGDIGVFH